MKLEQQHLASSQPSLPWWVRICRWLWKPIAFLGISVLFALGVNTLSTWFTNSKGIIPADSPAGVLLAQWPLTLLMSLCLSLLALMVWLLSRWQVPTTREAQLSVQDRERMLRRLRLRYEQMLAQSLQGVVQLELGLVSRPAAVHNAASLSLSLPDQPEHPLPSHTSIVQAYELAQQELLILGEPGSGKSTLLLELAHHLVEQAGADATQPLPIVLPLSSWAAKCPTFQDWLPEQVALLYNVPRRLSQQWIQAGAVLPLLDGLDEMEETARPGCIAAINTYHREHLHPLVVCSRTAEYDRATVQERLALHTAVVVQPLSVKQVDSHLEHLGKPLAALRSALRKNSALQELATTPLLLQVLMLTYHSIIVRDLSQKENQLLQQVWADYVQRMVSHKGDVKCYPLNITCKRLSWLARQMQIHNQTIFFLEELQPDWLPTKESVFYHRSVRLLFGLLYGASAMLFFGLLYGLNEGLLSGLLFGLPVGLLFGASPSEIRPVETLSWSWKAIPLGVAALLLGLYNSLLNELRGTQLTERLALAPNEGIRRSMKYGVFVGFLSGLSIWLSIILGLGAAIGPSVEGVGRLVGGVALGLTFGMSFALSFGLRAALQHYTLRCWLWQSGVFPLRAVPFLEDATARILLRRVGGGYSFSHRLLMDYFADLDTTAPPASTAESSSPTSNH